MTPDALLRLIIRPTLTELARYDTRPGMNGLEAEVMLLAIAIQESDLATRRQINGPARSFWQIEPATARDTLWRYTPARLFLRSLILITTDATELSYFLRYSDAAACAIARGILRLDPEPLPAVGDGLVAAWATYMRCWRPGKPGFDRWTAAYRQAVAASDK